MHKKIIIAIPSGPQWAAPMGRSLASLIANATINPLPGASSASLNILNLHSSILPQLRTHLILEARKHDATHIFMLDSDMSFPPDTLHRFMESGYPVVAANCTTKSFPSRVTAHMRDGEPVPTRSDSTGLQQVHRVGCAVMLCEMSIFEKIKQPWFAIEPKKSDLSSFTGEDFYFCKKLDRAGIPIYIDHDVSKRVEHWGTYPFSHELIEKQENVFASES